MMGRQKSRKKRSQVKKEKEKLIFSPLHPYTHRTQRLVGCPGVTAATELLNIR